MTCSRKAKAPALTRGGFVRKTAVSSVGSDSHHSTRAPVGRKAGVHGQCPVCNSHRYLGKQLALSLDGGQHCAAVCDSCHAAVSVSVGYAFTVVHRLAQQQHYIKGAASC